MFFAVHGLSLTSGWIKEKSAVSIIHVAAISSLTDYSQTQKLNAFVTQKNDMIYYNFYVYSIFSMSSTVSEEIL